MIYRVSLRAASVLCVLHAAMHQVGMMQSPASDAERAVISSMGAFTANVMGSTRSYLEFYSGLGVLLTVTLVAFGAVLWVLSRAESSAHAQTRSLLLLCGLTFVAFTAVSIRYFFIAPIVVEALIAALVSLAYFKSRDVV